MYYWQPSTNQPDYYFAQHNGGNSWSVLNNSIIIGGNYNCSGSTYRQNSERAGTFRYIIPINYLQTIYNKNAVYKYLAFTGRASTGNGKIYQTNNLGSISVVKRRKGDDTKAVIYSYSTSLVPRDKEGILTQIPTYLISLPNYVSDDEIVITISTSPTEQPYSCGNSYVECQALLYYRSIDDYCKEHGYTTPAMQDLLVRRGQPRLHDFPQILGFVDPWAPTPTPTVTPSLTPTLSRTPRPTTTPTLTRTPTPTPSKTPPPSRTPTRSVTPTPSITRTITPTPSLTKTSTLTPTVTPSITVSTSLSRTPTPTPTPTRTPPITRTPTLTPTKTPTKTPTSTATPTPSVTNTKTPRPSQTPTLTPSPTTVPDIIVCGDIFDTDGLTYNGKVRPKLVLLDSTAVGSTVTVEIENIYNEPDRFKIMYAGNIVFNDIVKNTKRVDVLLNDPDQTTYFLIWAEAGSYMSNFRYTIICN